MAQYAPKSAPQLSGLTIENVWHELQEIRATLETMQVDHVEYREHFREPDKPRDGRIYFADGTSWNPGYGRGLYIYASEIWEPLAIFAQTTRIRKSYLRLTAFAPSTDIGPGAIEPVFPGSLKLTGAIPTIYITGDVIEKIPSASLSFSGIVPVHRRNPDVWDDDTQVWNDDTTLWG